MMYMAGAFVHAVLGRGGRVVQGMCLESCVVDSWNRRGQMVHGWLRLWRHFGCEGVVNAFSLRVAFWRALRG